jgi:hypothetical protein
MPHRHHAANEGGSSSVLILAQVVLEPDVDELRMYCSSPAAGRDKHAMRSTCLMNRTLRSLTLS